ncbi:MAG: ergothioneine biosynthesis protein EgtC [Cyanobacteria bacterium P01_A01_bin.135]
MCRILGYLGEAIPLEWLLYQPEHSLVHQSYQPQEMTAGLLNADGFGVGWYRAEEVFCYRSVMPIWNDANLPDISRYVASDGIIASIRSATAGSQVSLSNCPPFRYQQTLMVHNGAVTNFQETLLTPLRDRLSPQFARRIQGSTDSEYLFALILQLESEGATLDRALAEAIALLLSLGQQHSVEVSANVLIHRGNQLVACRAGNKSPEPTLYWLQGDDNLPGVVVASEPLWDGKWQPLPEHTLITVEGDRLVQLQSL